MVRFQLSALLLLGLGAGAQDDPPPSPPVALTAPAMVRAQERLREGQRLMALDKFDDAARVFQEAITFNPLLVSAHFGLGTARMGLKEYSSAVAAFEAARAAFHDRAAVLARNRIETDSARQLRIWRMQSHLRDAVGPRGEEQSQRSMQAALAALVAQEEGKRLPQPPPGLFLALGSAYFRTGRLAEAEREYRAAIEAEPKLGEAHSNLAVVLLITGRAAEAKEQLALAEQNGYKPSAQLKADIEKARVSAPAQTP